MRVATSSLFNATSLVFLIRPGFPVPARSDAILSWIALGDKRHTTLPGGAEPFVELAILAFGQAANLPDRRAWETSIPLPESCRLECTSERQGSEDKRFVFEHEAALRATAWRFRAIQKRCGSIVASARGALVEET
jgi:hypothetical protein